MKKVLSIILTPTFGGPHNQMLRLNDGLKQNGFSYIVVTPDPNDSGTRKMKEGNVEVINIDLTRPRKVLNPLYHVRYLFSFWADVHSLRKIIHKNKVEIVQLCGLFNFQGAIAAKLEGKPIVWQLLSDFAPFWLRRLLSPAVIWFSDVIMTTGNRIAFQHPGVASFKNLIPFYPPVDTKRFKRDSSKRNFIRKQLNVLENEFLVGTIGNRNRQKAHHNFVEIASQLRKTENEIKFRIIGHDTESQSEEYRISVLEKAKRSGLNDHEFLKVLTPEYEISDYLSAFDLLLLTSDAEGVPTIVLEGMSIGLPVISTNVGAISEIIEDGVNGYLFEKGELKLAAARITELKNNQALLKQISRKNTVKADIEYDISNCVNRHVYAFNKAIKQA